MFSHAPFIPIVHSRSTKQYISFSFFSYSNILVFSILNVRINNRGQNASFNTYLSRFKDINAIQIVKSYVISLYLLDIVSSN